MTPDLQRAIEECSFAKGARPGESVNTQKARRLVVKNDVIGGATLQLVLARLDSSQERELEASFEVP